MSKFDEAMSKYTGSLTGAVKRSTFNVELLTKVAKALGPSIYLEDSSRVSCSDQAEKDRVKNNFLIKKHGLADGKNLDDAINAVCDEMGSSNRDKWRAVFYYLLVEKLGLQGKY